MIRGYHPAVIMGVLVRLPPKKNYQSWVLIHNYQLKQKHNMSKLEYWNILEHYPI